MQTKIDGVRIVIDGSVVSTPRSSHRRIRPMLLIELGNLPPLPPEPEKVDPRKTWLEVHGREPYRRKGKGFYEKRLDKAILDKSKNLDVALASSWGVEPKSGVEIKVSTPVLKENPVLDTEESRLNAVRELYAIATKHLYSEEQFREKPVVGAAVHMLVNIMEVLGMTPEELINDGEALADTLEYVKQIGKATKGIYAPSHLLSREPVEGDPVMELAYQIEDTWDLPKQEGFHYLTEDRFISSGRKGAKSANN